MRIVTVRRISQVFFFLLFLWFCLVSDVGVRPWQLRGWPVNWLLQLDPLVAVGAMLSTQSLYRGLLWALVTVVLTIILGRFFCSWVCPFGSIHHFVGYLGKRGKSLSARVDLNQYHGAQSVKYYLLFFLLTAAAGSLLGRLFHSTPRSSAVSIVLAVACLAGFGLLAKLKVTNNLKKALIGLSLAVGIWLGLSLVLPTEKLLTASLQTGLLDPIPLVHRSVNLTLLPLAKALSTTQRHYHGAWLIGTVFLAAVLLNLRIPRFYCRFVCPLGAFFGVLGRFALWRVGKGHGNCKACVFCERDCEGGCQPSTQIRISECVLCMNCLADCQHGLIAYRSLPSAGDEITAPDVSRRGFVISLVSGVAAIPMLRLGAIVGPDWNPSVLRPPGALTEMDFLKRCVKCGQCMRICPTNIIHPAGLESGLEGLWTPLLNFRIGTSGCQLNCIACSHICPTAALRPISLEEKLGRDGYSEVGPVRLGTAFVDRGRCLPWAMDRPCIVCQENCPVTPKAIFTRDYFSTLRDGVLPLQKADGLTLTLEGEPFQPGQLATGDYYITTTQEKGERRRRIVENSGNTVSISNSEPWVVMPHPGSRITIQVRLQRPFVDPSRCIGCGICEHECPVRGKRAIRITAEGESRNPERSMLLRRG